MLFAYSANPPVKNRDQLRLEALLVQDITKRNSSTEYSYLPDGVLSVAARLVPSRLDTPISSIEPLLLLHLFGSVKTCV